MSARRKIRQSTKDVKSNVITLPINVNATSEREQMRKVGD